MEGIDPKLEIKWIEKRVIDIQKGLLHIENVGLPQAVKLVDDLKKAIDQDKTLLEELRAQRIRISAQLEEEQKVEPEPEKGGEK